MKICHVCAHECAEDTELCPICGAELLGNDKGDLSQVINNPVLAVSVQDVVTAEIYRDMLRENGIPFTCDEENPDACMRVVFGGGFVAEDIYVDESNLEEAQRIYKQVLDTEPEFSDEDFEKEV